MSVHIEDIGRLMAEIANNEDEKRRRVYYQDITYAVSNLLDTVYDTATVVGTVDEPSTMVQDRIRELLAKPPIPCAEQQLTEIKAMLDTEQNRDSWHYSEPLVSSLVKRVLDRKSDLVTGTIARCREFQQDVLTFLRAFSLMLGTVGGASTHAEKAARLRGLVELVETAATKIRERQFKETQNWSYPFADDVFRSDYPVRQFIDKAREAEAKAARLEAELAERDAKDQSRPCRN